LVNPVVEHSLLLWNVVLPLVFYSSTLTKTPQRKSSIKLILLEKRITSKWYIHT
jgi:hypothetical protein